ncbi:MAG TPA: hypothetical protein VHW45_17855, partial [Candidatus Sulfotelmatobacter sp.]|nr:hypothetical protein [Candidatus Sulfotelmatobacter sp.]
HSLRSREFLATAGWSAHFAAQEALSGSSVKLARYRVVGQFGFLCALREVLSRSLQSDFGFSWTESKRL